MPSKHVLLIESRTEEEIEEILRQHDEEQRRRAQANIMFEELEAFNLDPNMIITEDI